MIDKLKQNMFIRLWSSLKLRNISASQRAQGVPPSVGATAGTEELSSEEIMFLENFTESILLSFPGLIWIYRQIFPKLFRNVKPETDDRGRPSARLNDLKKLRPGLLLILKDYTYDKARMRWGLASISPF